MKDIESSKRFIRNYLTDKTVLEAIQECQKKPNESNLQFEELCSQELFWRSENNKHYTEEQKVIDLIAHQKWVLESWQFDHNAPEPKKWWEGDAPIPSELPEVVCKITPGYVVQSYNTKTRRFLQQEFRPLARCSDEVEWEDDFGKLLSDSSQLEGIYHNFDMVQPFYEPWQLGD